MAYEQVNSMWPANTNDGRDLKPTPQEALSAARRLYRFAFKKAWRGPIKLTSGNRYSYIHRGTLYVNPDWRGRGGWHELVHLLSHSFSQRLNPSAGGHGYQHAFLEREMIAHVVGSGWLEGKLRRPDPKPVDRRAERRASLEARIASWERKQRRAENALRKLRRSLARYG